MKRISIQRFQSNPRQTLGNLIVFNNDQPVLVIKTLELPWKDNERKISCIPTGTYKAIEHISTKRGWTLWLQDVPGRTAILVHTGNYTTDILGCILPGIMHEDLNGDGIMDVKYSTIALEALKYYLDSQKEIEITIT